MDSKLSKERRKEGQRRHYDSGPPKGVMERRINIERRLFNLAINCGGEWGGSAPSGGRGAGSSFSG